MLRYGVAATALGLLIAQPVYADYSAGVAAYERNDYSRAYREFSEAAERGDADSQYMLGELYAKGRGVNQDFVAAHKWYNLAAARGRGGAAEARDALANQMTGDQVARAQQEASRFRAAGATSSETSGLPEQYSVANVQQALNRLGYDAGPVDGLMGSKTRSAIREFQRANGVAITGQADYDLYQRMRTRLGGGTTTTPPTARASAEVEASPTVIANVQSELRRAGYEIDAVSGTMDSQTRAAIVDYQLSSGLSATGVPSEFLLAHMRGSGKVDTESRTQLVRNVQQELNERGYDAGPADGAFGPKTRTAIRTYQSDAGLAVDGEADEELLARLRSDTTTTAAGTSTLGQIRSELSARGYQVGNGDEIDAADREAIRAYQRTADLAVTGEVSTDLLAHLRDPQREEPNTNRGLVRQIQTELKERGFSIGPVDGIPGPSTTRAIETYQKNMNMAVDGDPSVELLASLQQSAPGAGQANKVSVVRQIEGALQSKGYVVGTVDDTLDARSSAAIRQYQQDAGLNVDGQANEDLLAHIQGNEVRAKPLSAGEAAGEAAGQIIRRIFEQKQ